MRPEVIVLMGDFVSQENIELDAFDRLKGYFEQIGSFIRHSELECLRDLTQWFIMPSTDDPGMLKVFPSFKLSEFLISGFKGNGPQRIKKVQLATNPMRMSFRGKEMVFCRYNYFKKVKRHHLEKLQKQQDIQKKDEEESTPDNFKVAKTILH